MAYDKAMTIVAYDKAMTMGGYTWAPPCLTSDSRGQRPRSVVCSKVRLWALGYPRRIRLGVR